MSLDPPSTPVGGSSRRSRKGAEVTTAMDHGLVVFGLGTANGLETLPPRRAILRLVVDAAPDRGAVVALIQ